jgi:hypothetical protein
MANSIVGSTGNNLNLLTKKMLGVSNINGKYFNNSFTSEIDARPKIFSSNQLYSQFIPTTAPNPPLQIRSDFELIGSITSNGTFTQNPSAAIGTFNGIIYQSKQYPWIHYASQVPLLTRQILFAFYNPLMRTMIPYINTSYNALLCNNGTFNKYPTGSKTSNSGQNGYSSITQDLYMIDTDSGVLYMTNADFNPTTFGSLYMSFYYYTGTIGIPTNLGSFAGAYNQSQNAIAYGTGAGMYNQGSGAIAIGTQAGQTGQGQNSIAIGYLAGPSGMSQNSIALNASGRPLLANTGGPTGGFYVNPISDSRNSKGPFSFLAYGSDNQVVSITGAAMANFDIQIGSITGSTGSFTYLTAETLHVTQIEYVVKSVTNIEYIMTGMSGGTGHFDYFGIDTVTGGVGHFNSLGIDTLTGSTGYYKSFAIDTLTGGSGHMNFLGADLITGSTGYYKSFAIDTLTGGSGHFNFLGANLISGSTGYYKSFAIDTLTGGSGHMNFLGADLITGSTGYYKSFAIDTLTGGTGNFNFLGANLITGSTGYYKSFAIDTLTGGSGHMNFLGADIITGSTGYYKSFAIDTLTGGTGHFNFLGANLITGSTGYYKSFAIDTLTGGTGHLRFLGADLITGSTGYYKSFAIDTLTGGSGHMNFLGADLITGSTGYYKSFAIDTLTGGTGNFNFLGANLITGSTGYYKSFAIDTLTGGTGHFNFLGANLITGSTGYYKSFAIDNLTGGTGHFNFLGANNITGSTGYYKSFAIDTLTGGTGHFNFLGAESITGSTGYYKSFAIDALTGGTGHLRFLGAESITGSTGYYKSFAIDTLTGGTGHFNFLGANLITGSTGYYKSFAIDTLTGSTGHLRFLGAESITGSTGYYKSFAIDTLTGGSGHMNFLGADLITGSTGYYKSFAIDTLTGGTGHFNFVGANNITGSTGYYKSFAIDTLTGGTGHLRFLGAESITGSTGYYKSFAIDALTGGTGHLRFLGAESITGSTGYYKSFAIDTLTGSTGHLRFLGAESITGSTGYYKSFAIDTLTGGTGYFTNVITSKIGVNAGMTGQNINAIAIGTNAGQYNQGTGSIAIGYMAGQSSMTQNSIALNASGLPLHATGPTGGFFVAPIASYSGSTGPFTVLAYGADNQVVQYTTAVTSSTPTVTYDPWSLSNLVNAPPGVNLTIDNYTTTDVYIVFNYPQQVSTAFGLMPMISSMYVNMSAGLTGETGTSTFTIPNTTTTYSVTGSNYLGVTGSNGTGSYFISTNTAGPTGIVQCINITKSNQKQTGLLTNYTVTNTTQQSLKASGTTIPCYTINYSALANGSPASFYMWYGNGNPSVNVSNNAQFEYKLPRNPTPVSLFTISSNNTTNVISFAFTGSSRIDAGDQLSTANLCYNVYYQPVAGSNVYRYGGTVDTRERFFTSYVTGATGGNTSSIITNGIGSNVIYPDTSYIIKVNASNTTLGTSTFNGTTGISSQGTTGPSVPTPQTNGSASVPIANLISGKSISGGTVTNLLPTRTITTAFNRTFAIQNTMATRGSTGTSLVSFTSSLTGFTGGTGLVGPSMSLNGFSGSYNYVPVTLNGITIIPSQPVDQYPSGPAGWTGYYLQNTIRVGITGSILAANSNPYTLSITGGYPSTNSGVSSNYYTSFYYDGEPQVPLIKTTPQLSLVSSTSGNVCGVKVINTSCVFSLTTTGVTGIGNYFYNPNANGIISYIKSGPNGSISPNNETTLSNLTSALGSAGFGNEASFTNGSITLSGVSNTYMGPVGINVVPYNTWGTGGSSVSSNGITCIFDPVSLSRISGMNTANGIRVFSTKNAANMAVASYNSTTTAGTAGGLVNNNIKNVLYDSTDQNSSGTPYISTSFNNSEKILNGPDQYSLDAMLYNGIYGSGYLNYSTYYYGPNQLNTSVDYSGITSGTRYVTFAYDVTNVTLPFQNIKFTITGLTNVNYYGVSPNGTLYYGTTQSTRLVFFYRLEDSTSQATAINWSTNGQVSTPWIDGNLIPSGTQSLPTSVNFSNIYFTPAGLTSATYSGGTALLYCVLGNKISSANKSGKMTLYCRIGLAISSTTSTNTTFTGITYSLS